MKSKNLKIQRLKIRGFKIRSFKYYISEALKSMARNSLMSISGIATVASCVFILILSYCIAANIGNMLKNVENSEKVQAFLVIDISENDIQALYDEIGKIPHVTNVEYVTSKQAMDGFIKKFSADDQNILNSFSDENILPSSFIISADSAKNLRGIINTLESAGMKAKGVNSVGQAQEVVDILVGINNAVRIISIFIILILALVAVVIIINTIKLTVNSRRSEIGIMKYVGATDWFIKWPFVFEGVIIGVIGAIIPVIISWFAYGYVIGALNKNYSFVKQVFSFLSGTDIFPMLLPIAVLMGAAIGVIGSITSMRRYLKV